MGWLFKTVVGAAIAATVGFFVTKYWEGYRYRSDRPRVDYDRRSPAIQRRPPVDPQRPPRRVER